MKITPKTSALILILVCVLVLFPYCLLLVNSSGRAKEALPEPAEMIEDPIAEEVPALTPQQERELTEDYALLYQDSLLETIRIRQTDSAQPEEEPKWPKTAALNFAASLHAQPSAEGSLLVCAAGDTFQVAPSDEPLWYYAVRDSDGHSGYLYAECLFAVREDGTVSEKSLFEEGFAEELAYLKHRLPEGKYWNHMGFNIPWGQETPYSITDTPCDHGRYGEGWCNFYVGKTYEEFGGSMNQCLGFASLLSDSFFGENAGLHVFYDPKLLRIGDHIRLNAYTHSMTVIALDEEGITVGEVNENYNDCAICWSRRVSWEELEKLLWDTRFISRYPLCPDGKGGFLPWPDEEKN